MDNYLKEYYVDSVDGVIEEDDEEENNGNDILNYQKELIDIVKANPPLWDKRQKEYSGKNFNKELAWNSVAAMLGNMSGSEAEKEFYKIRQKYGKERRKVMISLKGKSGQSAQSPYVSTWELYEICDSFLGAVIIPRKTTSNYTKATSVLKSNEINYLPAKYKDIMKPSVERNYTITTHIPNASWTPDLCASISSDDITCDSDISDSAKILHLAKQQQTQAQFQSQTQSSSADEMKTSKQKINIAEQVTRTMNQTTAKIVPSPDNFYKRKRKSDDEFTRAYIKQCEGLNNLAVQVSQTLLTKNNPESAHAETVDPITGAIRLALTQVKDEDKFECMLHVLQYINEKYVKNKK